MGHAQAGKVGYVMDRASPAGAAPTVTEFDDPPFASIEDVRLALRRCGYIAGEELSVAVFLALSMNKPLYLEGSTGVGKTELAKSLALVTDSHLIRLQCHEGLDLYSAAYDWNYLKQLLEIRLADSQHDAVTVGDLFGRDYLIRRPLLEAVEGVSDRRCVLLIDEIDRSDEEFEAYLLEFLAEFQLSIPEIGTIRADRPPYVIITSNRTREVHEALRRRCIYHWVDFPSLEQEVRIVQERVPAASERLARDAVALSQQLRNEGLYKPPGIAESIDWVQALGVLGVSKLDTEAIEKTLGVLLKDKDDWTAVRSRGIENLAP